MLFSGEIRNLKDWGNVFQDKQIFTPLAEQIFRENGLPFSGLDACTPGSNAVFRAGAYIVKIFAPEESEIGSEEDFLTEKYGLQRAGELKITVPGLIADGVIRDKYVFRYLVMEYVEGDSLAQVSGQLSGEEKQAIGKKLRQIVDRMDTPCPPFNRHRLFAPGVLARWEQCPAPFRTERERWLRAQRTRPDVFVHGDLNPDNILLRPGGEICLIDLADALLAPVELEEAAVLCDGFRFDRDYLRGYCGEYRTEELADRLLYGLLIHDYGVNIIRDTLCPPEQLDSIRMLRERITANL